MNTKLTAGGVHGFSFLGWRQVPQRHADALAALPRLAALFHNDCLWLAHASLQLCHGYRNRLPAPLNRTATAVDLAPALRALGEHALTKQIALQQVR